MAVKGLAKGVDTVMLLNTIRAEGTPTYQERIPEATRDNITAVGDAIINYEATRNEFLDALINRIGMVLIQNKLYENPLRRFKKGKLEFGKDIEEVFVDIAKAQHYDPAIAEDEVFKRVIPNVKAIFHRLNRQDFYKATISNDQLRTAFLTYRGIEDLIAKIVDSLYSGDNLDEFLLMKNLMNDYADKFYQINVKAVTDETTAKAFLTTLRATATKLGFMSNAYNAQGVYNFSRVEDLVIFMTPETEALIDVEALARAFNIEYTDFIGQVVIVDDFGGLTDTVALMVDRSWFMVYDTFFTFTEQYNAQGLYWNYFFHHWEILSTSQFANAIQFTTAEVVTPSITSVEVTPSTATVTKPGTQQLTATVTKVGNINDEVRWTISGSTAVASTVSAGGLVTIPANEPNTTLTVTATSVVDGSKSGSATITVSAGA